MLQHRVICALIFLFPLPCSAATAQQSLPDAPSPKKSLPDAPKPKNIKTQTKELSESGWPRTFSSGNGIFTIYQPQADRWEDNVIHLYCAVELKTGKESAVKYGVAWFQARTEVDKVNRLVTLDQAKVTRVKFPAAHDKEPELTARLEKRLPGATKTISLDRLETALEVDNEVVKGVDVKNDPPRMIITSKPLVCASTLRFSALLFSQLSAGPILASWPLTMQLPCSRRPTHSSLCSLLSMQMTSRSGRAAFLSSAAVPRS
jgi:hypothetical protein